MTTSADRPRPGNPAAIGLLCFLAEAGLAALLAAGTPALALAVPHLAVSIAVIVLLARATGDFADALAVGAATLTLGPAGTLAALAGQWWTARAARDPSLAEWHETIAGKPVDDPAAALYRDIVENRSYRPGALPVPFARTMACGTVESRQRVLGLVSKRKDLAPEDLLAAGLCAPELAVRASAAAVVARLRDRDREGRP